MEEEYEDLERLQEEADAESQLEAIERAGIEEDHELVYLRDIQDGRVARPPWLFEDFLLSQSLTLISGEPFAGKTMLLAAMMLSLDSGEPLAGAFAPAPHQRVLFLGQDSPTWDYAGQFKKLTKGLGGNLPETNGSILMLNKGLDLLSPEFLPRIERILYLYRINVLMIDTLLEFHNLDENSNGEMKRVMGLLKHLRDKHFLSILATTHTAKGIEGRAANYRVRGASVIAGSVDQHILVRPHYANSKTDGFYFKVPKSRGGHRPEESEVIRFVSAETPDGPSLRLEYAGGLYSDRQAAILAAMTGGPTLRKRIVEVVQTLYPDLTKIEQERRATNSLRYLEMKGKIVKVERGVYRLPEVPK